MTTQQYVLRHHPPLASAVPASPSRTSGAVCAASSACERGRMGCAWCSRAAAAATGRAAQPRTLRNEPSGPVTRRCDPSSGLCSFGQHTDSLPVGGAYEFPADRPIVMTKSRQRQVCFSRLSLGAIATHLARTPRAPCCPSAAGGGRPRS